MQLDEKKHGFGIKILTPSLLETLFFTILLEVSIGRDFGVLKGLTLQRKNSIPTNLGNILIPSNFLPKKQVSSCEGVNEPRHSESVSAKTVLPLS